MLAPGAAAQVSCGLPPDSEPCPIWTARHDGPGGGTATDIALAPDGSAAYVAGIGSEGATAVSYDVATGAERWAAAYGQGLDHTPEAMALSPDGSTLFLTGPSVGAGNDYLTAALDTEAGELAWSVRLDGAGLDDYPWDIAASGDGARVYVTGYLDQGPDKGARNFVTLAYGTANGEELWRTTYEGPGGRGDVARAIEVGTYEDDQGVVHERVFLTGRSGGDDPRDERNDYATLAYDGETGAHLWEARYDGPAGGRDYPLSLAVSPDQGTVYVTGESAHSESGFDYATVAYDADSGEEIWVSRFDRQEDPVPEVAYSTAVTWADVAPSPAGDRVYVAGYGSDGGLPWNRSAVSLALDAVTGEEIWSTPGTGPLAEWGKDVLVSPDGRTLYVGGQAGGSFGCVVGHNSTDGTSACTDVSGYLALSYDAGTGAERWIARHGMGGSDAAYRAAALSHDGSLLILTGSEYGDLQTVAYRT
jgi:DNA-binding beta-propeller fold protein YncE